MKINIINKNKLEIQINVNDLEINNISIPNFMSSLVQNQKFIIKIIDSVNSFNYKNCKFETIFIPSKEVFVIIVTKLSHNIKSKYKINTFFLAEFSNIDNLCNFSNCLNVNTFSSLYYFNSKYYLYVKLLYLRDFKKLIFNSYEFCVNFKSNCFINENLKLIIQNNAIETCKKLA